MRRPLAVSSALAALVGLGGVLIGGCSAETVPQFDEHVCDGSGEIRLAAVTAGGGPTEPGSQVLHENGFDFLFMRGDCTAWVKPSGWWEPVRSLPLTDQGARQLFDALSLGSWHALSGEYSGGAFDASALVLLTPSSRIVCAGPCEGRFVPAEIARISRAVSAQILALSDAGTALDGGVRFTAVRSTNLPPGFTLLDWPLPSPTLADVALPESEQLPGRGIAVVDPGAAAALRRLLQQALAGAGQNFLGFVPARDDAGFSYRVYLRDMLPFESDAGLVTLPGNR